MNAFQMLLQCAIFTTEARSDSSCFRLRVISYNLPVLWHSLHFATYVPEDSVLGYRERRYQGPPLSCISYYSAYFMPNCFTSVPVLFSVSSVPSGVPRPFSSKAVVQRQGIADAEIKISSAENLELPSFLVYARGRPEYSFICFAYCHGFFFSNFCLLGSFNFIFPVLLNHSEL